MFGKSGSRPPIRQAVDVLLKALGDNPELALATYRPQRTLFYQLINERFGAPQKRGDIAHGVADGPNFIIAAITVAAPALGTIGNNNINIRHTALSLNAKSRRSGMPRRAKC